LGNRYQLLGRILRVLTAEGFDGVMGTPDVIEELLIVDHLIREGGGEPLLDDKVLLGCMNRGGIVGTVFELDDRYTSWTAEAIAEMGLDGGKLMFRLEPGSPEAGATLEYTAQAIRKLNAYDLPVFLECLPVERTEEGYKIRRDVEALVRVINIATALGDSSRNLWLKVPYVEPFEPIAEATTCPMLLLGGEARGELEPVFEEIGRALKSGPTVRGVLLGRNMLFPGPEDPRAVARAVYALVHEGISPEEALKGLEAERDRELERLRRARRSASAS